MIERKDIWKAETADGVWNQLVLAYALAFGVLARPDPNPAKPESWQLTYQAAVHDMVPLPPDGDLRATCQHDTWFFLPWHRMFLFHFEAVIRAILAELDDDRINDETRETWALPYWDYLPEAHRTIPTAFRQHTLPDGEPNPLAQARRYPKVQSGEVALQLDQVEFTGWWSETVFSLPGTPSFGGSDTGGPRHHPLENFPDAGDLEVTPHGTVHGYVGPDMRSFHTAGLDPIFWLHHCNLDRLWEVWCQGGGTTRPNPTSGGWTTEEFRFLDVDGAEWRRTSQQVADTTVLGYTYADTSAPTAPSSPTRSRTVAPPATDDEAWRRELAPRALGTAPEAVVVQSEAATVDVPLTRDDQVFTRAARPGPARVILQVGNIEITPADVPRIDSGEALIGSYAVYLVGEQADGGHVEAFAGNLPLFGLRESLRDEGHQLAYSFDVTSAVDLLRDEAAWNWSTAGVRIEPSGHEAYEGAGEVVPITFGTVTFSYQ